MVVVLREAEDPIEDVLSARASGAIGGGLVVDKEVGLNDLDISLIPPNFVAESFGLEVGRGGGTIILVLCGVVGLAGGDTDEVVDVDEDEESSGGPNNGSNENKSLLTLLASDGTCDLDRISSSLDEFLFIAIGLCLDGEGESVIFPMEAFNSSNVWLVSLLGCMGLICTWNFLGSSSSEPESLDE